MMMSLLNIKLMKQLPHNANVLIETKKAEKLAVLERLGISEEEAKLIVF